MLIIIINIFVFIKFNLKMIRSEEMGYYKLIMSKDAA